MTSRPSRSRHILMIVENLPVPFDRRVWNEATSLKRAGYEISVICPKGKGQVRKFEEIDGIRIYRHPLPPEGNGPAGYLLEYSAALFWQFWLSLKVFVTRGFDAIHACNPPDNIFLIGFFFKCFGKKFVFDHHDINPELYIAKFGRRDIFYRLMLLLERLTFKVADISIATNESFKEIAVRRGKMHPDRVFVVRSGPDPDKIVPVEPHENLKENHRYLVGYVGVIARQDGLDYLMRSIAYIRNVKKRNDILFVVIGDGPAWNEIKDFASELGIQESVKFAGYLSGRPFLEYLSTAEVCVSPDVANEMNDKSTMNKVMEYMCLKKPVVQFDLKEGRFSAQGASLYARKNDTADFGDKILELLEDAERRQSMGEFGRKRILESLAWKYSERELLKAYETLFQPSYSHAAQAQVA